MRKLSFPVFSGRCKVGNNPWLTQRILRLRQKIVDNATDVKISLPRSRVLVCKLSSFLLQCRFFHHIHRLCLRSIELFVTVFRTLVESRTWGGYTLFAGSIHIWWPDHAVAATFVGGGQRPACKRSSGYRIFRLLCLFLSFFDCPSFSFTFSFLLNETEFLVLLLFLPDPLHFHIHSFLPFLLRSLVLLVQQRILCFFSILTGCCVNICGVAITVYASDLIRIFTSRKEVHTS
mmetsp:Transcript_42714/g.103017  ORF Transcript_42714/g.103017 Transcript_42714/m.103017 type:complete len:233 (+) Transcript_42714:508-1206(+)